MIITIARNCLISGKRHTNRIRDGILEELKKYIRLQITIKSFWVLTEEG